MFYLTDIRRKWVFIVGLDRLLLHYLFYILFWIVRVRICNLKCRWFLNRMAGLRFTCYTTTDHLLSILEVLNLYSIRKNLQRWSRPINPVAGGNNFYTHFRKVFLILLRSKGIPLSSYSLCFWTVCSAYFHLRHCYYNISRHPNSSKNCCLYNSITNCKSKGNNSSFNQLCSSSRKYT